jgi:hypothetical protein
MKKDPGQMSPSEINRELDRLWKKWINCLNELIFDERAFEPHSEIMGKSDPLSLEYQEIFNRNKMLRNEVLRRYGSGIYRCPVRRRKTR